MECPNDTIHSLFSIVKSAQQVQEKGKALELYKAQHKAAQSHKRLSTGNCHRGVSVRPQKTRRAILNQIEQVRFAVYQHNQL